MEIRTRAEHGRSERIFSALPSELNQYVRMTLTASPQGCLKGINSGVQVNLTLGRY